MNANAAVSAVPHLDLVEVINVSCTLPWFRLSRIYEGAAPEVALRPSFTKRFLAGKERDSLDGRHGVVRVERSIIGPVSMLDTEIAACLEGQIFELDEALAFVAQLVTDQLTYERLVNSRWFPVRLIGHLLGYRWKVLDPIGENLVFVNINETIKIIDIHFFDVGKWCLIGRDVDGSDCLSAENRYSIFGKVK